VVLFVSIVNEAYTGSTPTNKRCYGVCLRVYTTNPGNLQPRCTGRTETRYTAVTLLYMLYTAVELQYMLYTAVTLLYMLYTALRVLLLRYTVFDVL